MMPGNVFCLQLAAAFADRGRIILRIAVSALLAMPFVFVGMPSRAQAAGIVMVILFTGFFGAAVGHARLRFDSRLARLSLLPISRPVLWLDLVLASALSRLAPPAIVVGGFALVNGQGATPTGLVVLFGLLCGSLILVTLLGMATGRLARSNGEVHLFGALACGMLAFVSGVTPVPERLAWLTAITSWNPIARLLAVLTRLAAETVGGAPTNSMGNELPILPLTRFAAEPASGPGTEFVLASLVLVTVAALATARWIAGKSGQKSRIA